MSDPGSYRLTPLSPRITHVFPALMATSHASGSSSRAGGQSWSRRASWAAAAKATASCARWKARMNESYRAGPKGRV